MTLLDSIGYYIAMYLLLFLPVFVGLSCLLTLTEKLFSKVVNYVRQTNKFKNPAQVKGQD